MKYLPENPFLAELSNSTPAKRSFAQPTAGYSERMTSFLFLANSTRDARKVVLARQRFHQHFLTLVRS